jgi:hypothetical protein
MAAITVMAVPADEAEASNLRSSYRRHSAAAARDGGIFGRSRRREAEPGPATPQDGEASGAAKDAGAKDAER